MFSNISKNNKKLFTNLKNHLKIILITIIQLWWLQVFVYSRFNCISSHDNSFLTKYNYFI